MQISHELQEHLLGRALLLSEIPFALELVQSHIDKGFVKVIQTLQKGQCMRCGNQDQSLFATYPCYRCGKNCIYCRNCIMMGRMSSCTQLYIWVGSEPNWQQSTCYWEGQLSSQQQEAADRILATVAEKSELLLWAVAGAGKTEMIFAGVELALRQGERVAIACPRVDVILELEPRIKAAFPDTTIAVLYGDSDDKQRCAQLVLTTTHQLFRYKNAFELVIVDEVDAFPYAIDKHLQYAVRQATKEIAAVIYLTATPPKSWQREFFQGKRAGLLIPARYHRHPIPVPTVQWIGNWRKAIARNRLPQVLQTWLQKQKNPFLLFFPHIELMEQALPLIQLHYPNVLAVHAEDPDRKEKVQLLRQAEIKGLLTTTILERGVTIKQIDVAVIGAEDRIFTEAALVQITGRVGRSADFPTGEVVFFHHGKTTEMSAAIKQIKHNNQVAFDRGLVDYR